MQIKDYFSEIASAIIFKAMMWITPMLGVVMLTEGDEWRLAASAVIGGSIGAAIGVFIIATSKEIVWKVHLLRWVVNLCFAVIFGPMLAIKVSDMWFGGYLGPSIGIACGGVMGMLGLFLLQLFLPALERRIRNLDKIEQCESKKS